MAVIGEAPTLFLRKATGLVKGWSKFDAFLYSFMSVNFVTLGLFFALSVLAFVPTGQVLPALLISGVFVSFLVVTYAGMISVMPRAGGDYVWQSRVMGGGIAFVLDAMGSALHSILDITIVYPNGRPSMADLFADRIGEVRVEVQQYPIPAELRSGNYQNDPAFRERVQAWINSLWSTKDRTIAKLLT